MGQHTGSAARPSQGQPVSGAAAMSGDNRPGTLRFARAAQLFEAIPQVAEDMEAVPDPGVGTLEFMSRLADSSTPEEAITFAAQALQRRHAVWWAHECLRHLADVLDPGDPEMLALAARWVAEPSEANRVAAQTAAMEAPAKTPGVWVALGAAWSGGSLAPPDLPPVPPAPHLTGRALNAAVLSALARVDQAHRAQALAGFVRMAHILATQE